MSYLSATSWLWLPVPAGVLPSPAPGMDATPSAHRTETHTVTVGDFSSHMKPRLEHDVFTAACRCWAAADACTNLFRPRRRDLRLVALLFQPQKILLRMAADLQAGQHEKTHRAVSVRKRGERAQVVPSNSRVLLCRPHEAARRSCRRTHLCDRARANVLHDLLPVSTCEATESVILAKTASG